jgi:hypothetical protein
LFEEHREPIDSLLLGAHHLAEMIALAFDLTQEIVCGSGAVRRLSGEFAGFVRRLSGARRHRHEPPTVALDPVEAPPADAPADTVTGDPESRCRFHQIDEFGVWCGRVGRQQSHH